MGPSQSQLRLLSPEDRVVYRQWLRYGVLFYSCVMALLIVAGFANRIFTTVPPDMVGDTLHTAAISARK